MYTYYILNGLAFTLLSVFFGFLIDALFPLPSRNDGIFRNMILLFLQVIISIVVIATVEIWYEEVIGYSIREYLGLDIFVVLLFITQSQLGYRFEHTFERVMGRRVEPRD